MNKIEGWVKDICRRTLDENYAISTRGIFEFDKGCGCLVQREIG